MRRSKPTKPSAGPDEDTALAAAMSGVGGRMAWQWRVMPWVAAACGAGFIAVTSRGLPPVVAVHFAGRGVADGFMSAVGYAWLMTVLVVALPLLVANGWLFRRAGRLRRHLNIPHRDFWLAPPRLVATACYVRAHMAWAGVGAMVFLCHVHAMVVRANELQPPALPMRPFMAGLGLFLAALLVWLLALWHRFRRPAHGA